MDHRNTLVVPAQRGHSPVLGRYRLHQRLGAGGFGVVWLAHDELLNREVALKQISLPTDEDRDRATREAHATARLSHPAIVALYEACSDDEHFYLISELVHGETLATLIAEDALSDEELVEVGVVLCDALAHAHARGVVHRDIKPQNVLLPDRPADTGATGVIAKLTDFGGAQILGEEGLTRSGDVLGTLAYMAPEQSEGREAGAEADLYALALVLYEAFSGVNPVRAATPAATVRRIGQPLPPLERHRRDLPRTLTRALNTALLPNSYDRGTLDELREQLEDAAEEIGGTRTLDYRRDPRPRLVEDNPAQPAELDPGMAAAASIGWSRGRSDLLDRESSPTRRELDDSGWLTLERLVWLVGVFAVCAWQLGAARAGIATLVPFAVLPLVLAVRRPGPSWLVAALAPLLGMLGLAAVFPAVAGQATRWRKRALMGALGYWWLALAEPLLGESSSPLWLGPPAGIGGPAGYQWRGSVLTAFAHVLVPTATLGLLFGAALWGLAATLLPLVVRGDDAKRDALGAIAWAVVLASATPLLLRIAAGATNHAHVTPRGLILGTACGAAGAICVRALRGSVSVPARGRTDERADAIT